MKAIGFKTSLALTEQDSFIEFETAKPKATGRDLLVKIKAISVNPVDFKIRQSAAKDTVLPEPKVIGWDAAGIVEETGSDVTLFKKGDTVYYAGDLTRTGCNAEYQLVDERIVGRKPQSLTDAEAAALPLTTLTAWEILFVRMRIDSGKDKGKTLLIIGGAGGVGSIAIQIAKKVAGLKVIATASRPESADWCRKQGADVVVNHQSLVDEVRKAGITQVDFILDFVDAGLYWDAMAELIKPQGHIASISPATPVVGLKNVFNKSVSFSWELMYTRSMFQTEDMSEQHAILNKTGAFVDAGMLKTTLAKTLNGFTVENLKELHRLQESGKTIGKNVMVF